MPVQVRHNFPIKRDTDLDYVHCPLLISLLIFEANCNVSFASCFLKGPGAPAASALHSVLWDPCGEHVQAPSDTGSGQVSQYTELVPALKSEYSLVFQNLSLRKPGLFPSYFCFCTTFLEAAYYSCKN
jgi:hypothetical protein